jgi:hypothetical protein
LNDASARGTCHVVPRSLGPRPTSADWTAVPSPMRIASKATPKKYKKIRSPAFSLVGKAG